MWVLKLVSEASNSAPHKKGPSSTNLHLPSERSIQIGITSWWFRKGICKILLNSGLAQYYHSTWVHFLYSSGSLEYDDPIWLPQIVDCRRRKRLIQQLHPVAFVHGRCLIRKWCPFGRSVECDLAEIWNIQKGYFHKQARILVKSSKASG